MFTPKDMARNMRASRNAQDEKARLQRVAPRTRLAYSTTTKKER